MKEQIVSASCHTSWNRPVVIGTNWETSLELKNITKPKTQKHAGNNANKS